MMATAFICANLPRLRACAVRDALPRTGKLGGVGVKPGIAKKAK